MVSGIIGIIGGVFTSLTDIVIVSMIISTIFEAIISPIEIIAFTLLYFDLRTRK